ncbi:hypothetical protein [Nonomuraea sp. CA-141351]|uniref:hypothetical protein n=1 Tax=Nonomuraea sp. CA-141351 TaxID=3239996 RepID=UPI003D8A45E0
MRAVQYTVRRSWPNLAGLTSERNCKLVKQAWRSFPTRDKDLIATFFTRDAEWPAPPGNATAVALGGSHHMVGRDAIVHFLTVDFRACSSPM